MCLAALVDAGVPLTYLREQLTSLGLDSEFTLSVTPTQHHGLRALYAEVKLALPAEQPAIAHTHSQDHPHTHSPDHSHGHSPDRPNPAPTAAEISHPPGRNLPVIERLITQAAIPDRARRWSLAVFRRLAEAEAAVHGIPIDQVHFHEVGATDAIVDIVGTCLGLDYLGIDTLVCSPLPTGRGRVRAAHGWLPVPAPAVLKLMEQGQVPLYSNGIEGELVTPTGAAIATALADAFGDPPPMQLQHTGLGAGRKSLPVPNILRLWVGQQPAEPQAISPLTRVEARPEPQAIPYEAETIVLLETQVDDMLPQAVGYLCDRLLAAGALDFFTHPLGMKKSRPGLLITTLCRPADEPPCLDILFTETPTLGIRRHTQQRWVLPRQLKTLQTPYGPVAVKLAYHPQTQALLNVHPEYEDCAALARLHQLPWQTIYQSALHTWHSLPSPGSDIKSESHNPDSQQAKP
jgi:pyridinium-3,5-bisthiocarboxylic acid mononucleotide nickel chelatase